MQWSVGRYGQKRGGTQQPRLSICSSAVDCTMANRPGPHLDRLRWDTDTHTHSHTHTQTYDAYNSCSQTVCTRTSSDRTGDASRFCKSLRPSDSSTCLRVASTWIYRMTEHNEPSDTLCGRRLVADVERESGTRRASLSWHLVPHPHWPILPGASLHLRLLVMVMALLGCGIGTWLWVLGSHPASTCYEYSYMSATYKKPSRMVTGDQVLTCSAVVRMYE